MYFTWTQPLITPAEQLVIACMRRSRFICTVYLDPGAHYDTERDLGKTLMSFRGHGQEDHLVVPSLCPLIKPNQFKVSVCFAVNSPPWCR